MAVQNRMIILFRKLHLMKFSSSLLYSYYIIIQIHVLSHDVMERNVNIMNLTSYMYFHT